MLTLYQFEISPFCDKVRRALRYKGIPFQTREMLFSRRDENLKVSPTHKFPLLEVDGERIVDSTDIAYWLEQRFPEPRMIPADPRERALMHVVEDWADESLFTIDLAIRALWEHNVPLLIQDVFRYETPELREAFARSVPAAVRQQLEGQGIGRKDRASLLRDLERHVDAIDVLVRGERWLVGGSLSYADIAVRAMTYVINRAVEGAELFGVRPAIRAWEARVDALTLPR